MKIIDIARLVTHIFRLCGQLLLDALGDLTGRGLSFDPKRFVTPQNLNDEINRFGTHPLAEPAAIEALSVKAIPSISSNCRNTVISIDKQATEALPASLFIKLPMPSLATRCFLNVTGSWQLESFICEHIAPTLPLRTPITYATRRQRSRFYLIQEDLNADPNVTLFTNPDMMSGVNLELAKRCVDGFAQLHAQHYDLSAQEREAILPLDHHPFLGTNMRFVSRALNGYGLEPCLKAQPGVIPDAVVAAYKRSLEQWEALAEFWFSGPLSLLHGDSHIGNWFADGDQMGLLDFQAVHWGKGIRDVQYFLIYSLPAELLAAHEQDLVQLYVDRRGHYGTAIDFENTWQEYRSFTYHTLMTIVVSIGFGALNEEQSALMKEMLIRAVAAVERVGYAEWLEDFCAAEEASHAVRPV